MSTPVTAPVTTSPTLTFADLHNATVLDRARDVLNDPAPSQDEILASAHDTLTMKNEHVYAATAAKFSRYPGRSYQEHHAAATDYHRVYQHLVARLDAA